MCACVHVCAHSISACRGKYKNVSIPLELQTRPQCCCTFICPPASLFLSLSPHRSHCFSPSRTLFLNSRDGNVEFQPSFLFGTMLPGAAATFSGCDQDLHRGSRHLMVAQQKLAGKLEFTAYSMRRHFSLCGSRKHQRQHSSTSYWVENDGISKFE